MAETLGDADAFAAAGPAAVLAFVRANGLNPTLREAETLAEQTGWTSLATTVTVTAWQYGVLNPDGTWTVWDG